MDDIPQNSPGAPETDYPGLPAGIEAAAREWNRAFPGWVATYVSDAPADRQWVADRTTRLSPDETSRGHRVTIRAGDLDALGEAVAEEVNRQTAYFSERARRLPDAYPWGGAA